MLGLLAVESRLQGVSCSKWCSNLHKLWRRMSKMALEQGFEKTGIKCDCGRIWVTKGSAQSKRPKENLPRIECNAMAVWGKTMPLFSSQLSLLAPARGVKC
jgi:hypothetical protein